MEKMEDRAFLLTDHMYAWSRREGITKGEGSLTMTLCCPVRLGGSQRSCVSDTVTAHGVSPISTV